MRARKSLRCSSDPRVVWHTTLGAIALGGPCWLDAAVGVAAAAGDAGLGAAVAAGIAETVTGAGGAAAAVVADAAGTTCSSSGGSSSSSTHVLALVQMLLPARGLMCTGQAR